ncbi:hypothetical protein EVAR_20005_1 [Eumeta japonica]|uniref:Uncharacterized protein n=1 Tax=Eumeta variegata TaxID=151549 RepID=A0A4C1VD00_EUMVA|nr:hypothetical protein EVAR_20005_1 [Eumeta japonica]
MAKTPAERAKDYRDRKRANKPPKQPTKTNRERCREYRARQKKLRANSSGVLNNISKIGEIREYLRVMPPPRSSQQRSRDCQQLNTDLRIDVQPSTSRFDDAHLTLDTSVSIDLPYATILLRFLHLMQTFLYDKSVHCQSMLLTLVSNID